MNIRQFLNPLRIIIINIEWRGNMQNTHEKFNLMLGTKIMDIRVRHKFTREYLAEKAEISTKFLYEIEMGRKGCSSYVLCRLADALGVSTDFLLQNEEALLDQSGIEEWYSKFENKEKKKIKDILRILYEISHEL